MYFYAMKMIKFGQPVLVTTCLKDHFCALFAFLNQVRAHGRLWACAWFPEIVLWRVCVCMYACMYACMYVYLFVFPHQREQTFTWSLKAACIQIIKAKESLYYTHAQVSSVFLSQLKTRRSDHPQTSKPAFLIDSQVFYNRKTAY